MHFGGDYSGTAWIHSLVDCTTMLCGKSSWPSVKCCFSNSDLVAHWAWHWLAACGLDRLLNAQGSDKMNLVHWM